VVLNIKFTTDNVEYKLERFYSPSESKLYEAELPEGIHGEFGDRETIKHISGLKKDEKTDKIVISDDARQYQEIAVYHASRWIHEIRLYKKLNPLIDYHRVQLKIKKFITRVWAFYDLLDRFRENPIGKEKGKLETESGIHFQENVP